MKIARTITRNAAGISSFALIDSARPSESVRNRSRSAVACSRGSAALRAGVTGRVHDRRKVLQLDDVDLFTQDPQLIPWKRHLQLGLRQRLADPVEHPAVADLHRRFQRLHRTGRREFEHDQSR